MTLEKRQNLVILQALVYISWYNAGRMPCFVENNPTYFTSSTCVGYCKQVHINMGLLTLKGQSECQPTNKKKGKSLCN